MSDESFDAQKHPLDVAGYVEGDYITPEEVEIILGQTRGTNEFQFELMKLCGWIMRTRNDLGIPMIVKQDHDGIKFLGIGEDGANYADNAASQGLAKFRRWHERLRGWVDPRQLTEERRRQFERRNDHNVRIALAMMRERRDEARLIAAAKKKKNKPENPDGEVPEETDRH